MRKITLFKFFFITSFLISSTVFAQNVIYYQDFQYFTNSGFRSFATSNPDGETLEASSGNALVTRKTGSGDIAPETTLGYTRPSTTIPDGGSRTTTSVKIAGNYGSNNLNATVWVVTDEVDISNYENMTVSFATKNAFKEGTSSNTFKVMIAKNYTDGTSPDDVSLTWIDVTSDIVDSNNDGKVFGNDGSFAYTYIDLSDYIDDAGSDKFALAFKYEFTDPGDYDSPTQPIRNGVWWVSDVRYYSTPVDVAIGAFSALNTSASGQTNIFKAPTAAISNANFSNSGTAKWDAIFVDDNSVPRLADGVEAPVNEGYLFEVAGEYNPILVSEVRHKLANATSSKGATGDSEWIVQASNDASSWTTVSTVITVGSNSADERTTILSTAEAYRYYRFVLNGPWTPNQAYTALQQLDFTTADETASTNNTIDTFNLSVYPNPSNSQINIDVKNNDAITRVNLIDLTGKTVYSNNSTQTIDVSNYAKGIYILQISTKIGESSSTKIVVK
ncbi:T9SS type A sorting domain-containing protein [Flavicella marina]|uniref:T9SS type A sorting domain-containing protein n=1 Tax=Flavicella marina TaxID=1475951 RepID=UPI0012659068|nr:T9SS type A sorting domain-containing protein [Flavicella marina]